MSDVELESKEVKLDEIVYTWNHRPNARNDEKSWYWSDDYDQIAPANVALRLDRLFITREAALIRHSVESEEEVLAFLKVLSQMNISESELRKLRMDSDSDLFVNPGDLELPDKCNTAVNNPLILRWFLSDSSPVYEIVQLYLLGPLDQDRIRREPDHGEHDAREPQALQVHHQRLARIASGDKSGDAGSGND